MPRQRQLRALVIVLLGLWVLLLSAPAEAATGTIDHIEVRGGALQLVVSLDDVADGASPRLDSVTTTFDGQPLEATAELVSSAAEVRRTAILAMDVSDSMAGPKFEEAKAAAKAFLREVPDDVWVGLVTFAGEVTVAQEPTQDADAVAAVLDSLQLSRGTRLYDGLTEAVELSGEEGSRSVLVLSDGRDTSSTKLGATVAAIERREVKVDVVALAQSGKDSELLQKLADPGNGTLLSADDPAALSRVFAEEARVLARQVLVTVEPPPELAGREGSMDVTLDVGDAAVTDSAFVILPRSAAPVAAPEKKARPAGLRPMELGVQVPRELMYAGIGTVSLALALIVVVAFGGARSARQDAVDRNIEAYTRRGSHLIEVQRSAQSHSVTRQAVAVAENVLHSRRGLEAALATRLEAAGVSMRPAEWLLFHVGVIVLGGLVGLLFGGAGMFLGLVFGAAGPLAYLALAKARRIARFKTQLADTLQLMAGSLSAGLSLAQSIDTVVSEGADPMSAEFRRALVEARLGVEIEEALSGVADRMQSVDFEWVVMAIRIQRDVGGNLAELLGTVAETIREREYLLRQVKTLSAEGRLSVWILGSLPPVFLAYLVLANPDYVMPLLTTPPGWIILVVMATLEAVGIFWMSRLVKIEV